MVQGLRLRAPMRDTCVRSLVWELDPALPLLRVPVPQLKTLQAATETWDSQIYKYKHFLKEKVIGELRYHILCSLVATY